MNLFSLWVSATHGAGCSHSGSHFYLRFQSNKESQALLPRKRTPFAFKVVPPPHIQSPKTPQRSLFTVKIPSSNRYHTRLMEMEAFRTPEQKQEVTGWNLEELQEPIWPDRNHSNFPGVRLPSIPLRLGRTHKGEKQRDGSTLQVLWIWDLEVHRECCSFFNQMVREETNDKRPGKKPLKAWWGGADNAQNTPGDSSPIPNSQNRISHSVKLQSTNKFLPHYRRREPLGKCCYGPQKIY